MNILDITSPKDIKGLSIEELEKLNQDIRTFLIESISKTGGHLGSSLGAIELICAMHYCFDSPKDKIIFDVGHQAYAHKILTGRANQFETLRQYKGLSGFLKREESTHDIWESGHAANSISAAIGYAMQRDLDKEDNHVICVIGDGSMTNGMSLEALNHLIELNKKVIIIINDNEMSISQNIGFINNMFKNLQLNESYKSTKKKIKNSIDKLDNSQKTSKLISNFKNKLKNEINQTQSFFNVLGFEYLGPIDGHDMRDLIFTLEEAKKVKKPIILHVKTTKGKGYLPAEQNAWHGVSKFDIQTGKVQTNEIISNSKIVSKTLKDLMDQNKDIVIITPAMISGSELNEINKSYPERITDVGIAEEHGTSLAAGLALAGKKPFLSIYSTFLQRSYDQVFQDIVRQKCDVVVGVDRAGLVGADGETHQGLYDISFLLHMPGVTIMQGKNGSELRSLLKLAFEIKGPVFIRYSRHSQNTVKELTSPLIKIEKNTWEELTKGSKVNIVSYGSDVEDYYNIYNTVQEVGVVNARFIKPLDEEMLIKISNRPILVVEESARIGGLYNFMLDFYNQKNIQVKIQSCAIDDHFVEHGSISEIKEQEKISINNVKEKISEILNG